MPMPPLNPMFPYYSSVEGQIPWLDPITLHDLCLHLQISISQPQPLLFCAKRFIVGGGGVILCFASYLAALLTSFFFIVE